MKMFGTGYQQEEMLHDMKMNFVSLLFKKNVFIQIDYKYVCTYPLMPIVDKLFTMESPTNL